MLSVLDELIRHPDGLPTLELALRLGSSQAAGPGQSVHNSYFATMRTLERRGLVRRGGRNRQGVIWLVTAEGFSAAADSRAPGAEGHTPHLRRDIYLGAAGRVSIIVRWTDAADRDKLEQIWRLVGEYEIASALAPGQSTALPAT